VQVAYGRYLSAPVVRMDLFTWAVSWAVVGGAIGIVVWMAKRAAPVQTPEMRRLLGKEAA
jgi:hypothetical protein